MKRRQFLVSSALGAAAAAVGHAPLAAATDHEGVQGRPGAPTRKILIAGGGYNTAFIRYMAQLTDKPRPRLLYLPTASRDSPQGIITWYQHCAPLNVEPSHQISFIASARQTRSWEDVLLSVDGIVCSGGNTLNQQVIWKAHGIDAILRPGWDRGTVLGGASAGPLCWFEEGTTEVDGKAVERVLEPEVIA